MLFKVLLLLAIPFSLFARPGYFPPWGKDAHLSIRAPMEEKAPPRSLADSCAEAIILFHQNVLSPVDGPRSHFRPSSSNYMLDAIHKYGFVKGFIMGCDRLLRENSDDWCYQTIESEGELFKYNPVP
jgi:putative component of membrane protein insertase Oxa1/YidC/SpoIIIJ protein YidD